MSESEQPPLSSPIRQSAPRWSWKAWGIWFASLCVIYFGVLTNQSGLSTAERPLLSVVAALLGASMFYGAFHVVRRLLYLSNREGKADRDAAALQASLGDDFFGVLVRINFTYLEKYYLQTQQQGDKSFLLCALAAVFGMALLLYGVFMMFQGQGSTELPSYLATGAGVLSEFIAAIFFYLYNKSIANMSDYHKKLVITQNIALALKITAELPADDQARSRVLLVESLVKDVNQLLTGQASAASNAKA